MRISDWSSDVCSSDLSLPSIHSKSRRQISLGKLRDPTLELEHHYSRRRDRAWGEHSARYGEGPNRADAGLYIVRVGDGRSEGRRGGKECFSPCRARWSPYHLTK